MVTIKGRIFSFRKCLIYFLFGFGSLLIGLFILPFEKILLHPISRFRRVGRKTVTLSYKLMVFFMKLLGLVKIEADKLDLANLKGKIVAPNHPSLLDVIILFSLIPGANCIVQGSLLHSVVATIIKVLYIPNNEDFEKLKIQCKKSLQQNETLIIFPEGTRTKKGQALTLKRGTACISIFADVPIVPFTIKGNDKEGLRKHDPFWSINKDNKYSFIIKQINTEIVPSNYSTLNERTKSFEMTKDLKKILTDNLNDEQ